MTSSHRSRGSRKWALGLALALCCACSYGGQSSDDGAPLLPHHDRAGDGAPELDAGMPEPDAGAPRFTVQVMVTLDGDVTYGCGAGFDPDVTEMEEVGAVLSAPQVCQGSEGRWECACEGESSVSYAAGCVGALLEQCGVAAEPLGGPAAVPGDCATTLPSRAGACERTPSGAYACVCDAAPERTVARNEASCEQALWAACAESCENDYGQCAPLRSSALAGAYRCDSPANGLSHDVLIGTCDNALIAGVDLAYESFDHCNGYGGYCDLVGETELRCTCADGSTHAAELGAPGYSPCRNALEATCGTGEPPADALCIVTENGFAGRCTRAPAEGAPYSCECVLHGATWEDRVAFEQVAGGACASALAQTCPQTEPLTEADVEATCDYYAECDTRYVGFTRESCLTEAPDVCVACTAEEIARIPQGADGCPEQRASCRGACTDLVPKAVAVAACEDTLTQLDLLTDQNRCLCDACHPAFGECIADSGCLEILGCAVERGCEQSTCEQDPVCGPIIERYYSTHSLGLVLMLGDCPARDACAVEADASK